MYTSVYYTASTHTRACSTHLYGDNRFFFPRSVPISDSSLNKHGTYAARIFQLYIARLCKRNIIFSVARANWTRHISPSSPCLGGPPKTRRPRSKGGCSRGRASRARVCSDDTRYIIHTRTPTHPHTHSHSHLDTRRRRFIIIQYGRVPTTAAFEHTHTLGIILYISHLYTYT